MKELIKVIAFDADDTLWSNEPFFQEVEKQYTDLLKPYDVVTMDAAAKTAEVSDVRVTGYYDSGKRFGICRHHRCNREGEISLYHNHESDAAE